MKRVTGVVLILIAVVLACLAVPHLKLCLDTEREITEQMNQFADQGAGASNGLIANLESVGYSTGARVLELAKEKEHEDELQLAIAGVCLILGVWLVTRKPVVATQSLASSTDDNPTNTLFAGSAPPGSGTNGWVAPGIALVAVIGLICLVSALDHSLGSSSSTTETNHPTSTPTHPAEDTPWSLDISTNPVTNEVTTVATTSGGGEHQYMVIRRRGTKLELYVNTDDFLETVDNIESRGIGVVYRLDDGKPVRQYWTISDDSTAVFYPGNPDALVEKLRHAHKFSIQYPPADKVPEVISFDVANMPQF